MIKSHLKQRLTMVIALLVLCIISLLIGRAVYTFASVGIFKVAWQKETSHVPADGSIVIAAIGDSTVQGIGGLRRSDSFISQVAKRISAKAGKPVQIINFSVSGSTSEKMLKNQLPLLKQLPKVDAVVIAIGPNDITQKKSLNDFLRNYDTVLAQLPAEKTVVASLPPMGPKDTQGRSSYDWGQALKPVAQKYNVVVAPVFDKVKPHANDFKTYGGDFYHPSRYGYKLWADAFEEPLLKILNNS